VWWGAAVSPRRFFDCLLMKIARVISMILVAALALGACKKVSEKKPTEVVNSNPIQPKMKQSTLQNATMRDYQFVAGMYSDGYFPNHLVDEIALILIDLCAQIEAQKPQDLAALYVLSHAATNKINDLEDAFEEADSELETVAREEIAQSFEDLSKAYGFEADIEELISTRNW
jgi:hypothetical protein